MSTSTHSVGVGYLLWLFGFTGAHRFYFGKRSTGLLWLLTGGLFGVGWAVDFWMLNEMVDEQNRRG